MLPFISPSAPKIYLGGGTSSGTSTTYDVMNFSTLKVPKDLYQAFQLYIKVGRNATSNTFGYGYGVGSVTTSLGTGITTSAVGLTSFHCLTLIGFNKSAGGAFTAQGLITNATASGNTSLEAFGLTATLPANVDCLGLNTNGGTHSIDWQLFGFK